MPGVLEKIDPAALRARVTKRAYWAARYTDGRIAAEWAHDWVKLPKRGMCSLRLYCPNGAVTELGNTKETGDRLFQFHRSHAFAGPGGAGRGLLWQCIGILTGLNGECTLMVWDYPSGRLIGPIEDNVHDLKYDGVGALSFEALGIRPD